VPPVVAEVVLVGHRVAFGLQDLGKLRFALVGQIELIELIPLRDAPILAVPLELVKMAVRPTVATAKSIFC
jgi:hypothetical protein